MKIQEQKKEIYFWGGLVVILLLWYIAGTNIYELFMIINDHTDGAETEATVLGKSFGLSVFFSFLAYRVGKWYGPIASANIPEEETIEPSDVEQIPKGDLALYTEWQWRRLLPELSGYGPTKDNLYGMACESLDNGILEFHQGGSSQEVQQALDKTSQKLEKLEQLDFTDTGYSEYTDYLRKDFELVKKTLSLVIDPIKPGSYNEKRLAILSATDDDVTDYSESCIENDGRPDPIYLEERLKDDPRIFDADYTCGRQYTTGGYSDDHPEVSTFSFKCLKMDLEDLKKICERIV